MSRGKFKRPAVERSRPDFDQPGHQDQRPPWEVPTPTSLRRKAREKAQRPAEPRRPALARREPTEEELEQVKAKSRAGLVLKAKDNHLRGNVYRNDKAGASCTCGDTAGQVCGLHHRLGHRRHVRPS